MSKCICGMTTPAGNVMCRDCKIDSETPIPVKLETFEEIQIPTRDRELHLALHALGGYRAFFNEFKEELKPLQERWEKISTGRKDKWG